MDLLCTERAMDTPAQHDEHLLRDPRVLQNLLKTEELYTTSSSYFQCVQTDVTPEMRKIVAEWMLEICESEPCQDGVFPLAMNYMDRFLSQCPLDRGKLQLIGAVCLLLASKIRETRPVTPQKLAYYTANSVDADVIPSWEVLVAHKLKWNLQAVTAQDFLHHLVHRIPLTATQIEMTLRHASTFICLASCDFKFCMYPPSIIAGSSIAAALNGISWSCQGGWSVPRLMDTLARILSVEKDYLYACLNQIEELIAESLDAAEPSNPNEKHEVAKAETPTDVGDVDF